MTAPVAAPAAEGSRQIVRLDRVTRLVHWVVAVLVLTMTVTGSMLYIGQLEALFGRRQLLARIHVVSGILLVIVGVAVVVVRPATMALRAELADLGQWTSRDRRWLRKKTRQKPAGKYNGGQKLATAAFGALLVMQIVTGAVMHWHDPFPDSWRTGATFVHDWGYLALVALIFGHIMKAIAEPSLLQAVTRGTVPRHWAEQERPGWLAEIEPEPEPKSAQ